MGRKQSSWTLLIRAKFRYVIAIKIFASINGIYLIFMVRRRSNDTFAGLALPDFLQSDLAL